MKRYRKEHISDEAYRLFQNELLDNPEKGDVIQGTGGLRKIRLSDHSRHKGKRGGARAIILLMVIRFGFLPLMEKTKKRI